MSERQVGLAAESLAPLIKTLQGEAARSAFLSLIHLAACRKKNNNKKNTNRQIFLRNLAALLDFSEYVARKKGSECYSH